jgi:hypothetical protein
VAAAARQTHSDRAEADEVSAVHARALDADDDEAELFEDRILYADDISRFFSSPGREWSTRRAKRWLKRSGIGFKMDEAGGGEGRWATTSIEMKEHYPKLWKLVLARMVDEL